MLTFFWKRRLLYGLGSGFFVLSILLGLAAFSLPLAKSRTNYSPRPRELPSAENSNSKGTELSAKEFRFVWGKSFRRPLVDPPAAKPDPKPAPVSPEIRFEGELTATLVATRPHDSRGWIQFGQNAARMVRPGDVLNDIQGNPKIVSISDRFMQIELQGREIAIEIAEIVPVFQEVEGK